MKRLTALALLIGGFAAVSVNAAETNDVVRDFRGGIVHDFRGGCVRTKWLDSTDDCKGYATGNAYMVFFDFDRATLTNEARTIIAQAAKDAKASGSKVVLEGHADRSGASSYNKSLSARRASSVQRQLVRNGVKRANISVTSKGESEPLVPTADGVREAQNRRVEIQFRK